ncbi:MAG: lysostaphin resistance A-like protein, partial [Christensenellales bacterium]
MLALFLPNILAIFCIMFLSFFYDASQMQNTVAYKIIATTISQISFLIAYFAITKTRKISFGEIRHKKLGFKQILILLLISFCCLFLISPIINVYDSFIVSLGIKEQTLPISLNSPLNFVYLIFTMGILAPISEELLFRGIILQGLENKGTKNAVLLSGLMFMIMHLSLHQTIYQFLLGVIMALIVIYTQSIFASIFVHFVNNSVVLFINYINPNMFDYKFLSASYIILAVTLFLFALLVLYYLLKFLKKIGAKCKQNQGEQKVCQTKKADQTVMQTRYRVESLSKQEQQLVGFKKFNWLLTSLICGVLIWILNLIFSIGG